MKIKYFNYAILLFCLLLGGCRKDNVDLIGSENDSHSPVVIIESEFNGVVFDSAGELLEGVEISIGDDMTTTDSEGYFYLKSNSNESGSFVKASLAGYYEAYGNVIPSADGISHVRFKMIERSVSGIVNSMEESTVKLPNESSVQFASNSFVTESGETYTGSVNVYMHYIDPTNSDISNVIPGDLAAVNLAEEDVILQSFGMLNVELESETGEALQISKPATIEVVIPESQLASANNEIPLWYFDTETGLWIEEGVAVKDGNTYTGTVEHFTLWNCDIPFPYVELSGTVKARSFAPNVIVKVTCIDQGASASTYTDDQGYFEGKVPADKALQVDILDECGVIIYTTQIGPLTEDEFITIALDPSNYNSFVVSGTLVCDGAPLPNGYAVISLDNNGSRHYATANQDGNFSIEILNCNSQNFDIVGVNSVNNQIGIEQTFAIEDNATVGNIESCGEAVVFEEVYSYDGIEYIIPNPFAEAIFLDTLTAFGYEIISTDTFSPNDAFTRSHMFVNWTGDANDPLWGMANELTVIGDPEIGLFISNMGEIEILTTLGYVEISLQNCTITDYVTGEEFLGNYFVRAKFQ